MKLFPKSGFETRVGTTPHIYSSDRNRPRNKQNTENFERIDEYPLESMPPSMSSNTAIIVTREVEQENLSGKLSLDSARELWRYKH
jgi:hypothetical protein